MYGSLLTIDLLVAMVELLFCTLIAYHDYTYTKDIQMEWQKFDLIHGIPLYVFSMPHATSIASALFVRVGTRDEVWPQEAGLAHATEHMMMQGTKFFPSSTAFADSIEEDGGELGAWTSHESTMFWNTVPCTPASCFSKAVFSLSQLACSPLFPQEQIGIEMSDIAEELHGAEERLDDYVNAIFDRILYDDHPLGREPLGTENALLSFSREQFIDFHKRFYGPAQFAFFVVGDIDPQKAHSFLNHALCTIRVPERQIKVRRSLDPAHIVAQRREHVETKHVNQVYATIGWLMPPAHQRAARALKVFEDMLDGGMSYPLFEEVRQKFGFCYGISASALEYTDAGDFSICMGVKPGKEQELIEIIVRVVGKSCSNNFLLGKIKKRRAGQLRMWAGSPSAVLMGALRTYELGQEPRTAEETIQLMNSFTIGEIEAAVKEFLDPSKMVTAMLIPEGR